MRQATWKEQSRRISELERRSRALLADASGAKEIQRLEGVVADRDAAIARLNAKLAAKDSAAESLKAANSLLSEAGRNARSELQAALRRCARLERANAQLESRLQAAEDRAWENSEKRREAEERAKAAERLLESERRARAAQIAGKDAQIARLLQRLSKDCTNSSLPPSLCPNARRKVCNSRERTGRLPGGQPGHEGHRRRQYEPDAAVVIGGSPECPGCGCTHVPTGNVRTHTVTDIEVALRTVAYVSSERRCPACGRRTWDPFPECAANESNYGPGVKAAATYLMNGCNVSKEKARDFLREITGGRLVVSGGSMTNFVQQMAERAAGDVAGIAAGVAASPVIASDATFTRSEGKRSYIYVFAGGGNVYYAASDAKGDRPLAESPLSLAKGATIVHDHDRSYYRYGARHAECNAHALRYLKGVAECEPGQVWASKLRALLAEANDIAKEARARGIPVGEAAYAGIKERYVGVLEDAIASYEQAMPENPRYRPDGYPLARRMLEYADEHLLFLLDPSVPYTNNLSERLLRVSKGKLKQSGGFRSTANGERPYCAYLSVTETAKARGESPYAAVLAAFGP